MRASLQSKNFDDAVQTNTASTSTRVQRMVDNRPAAVAQRELAAMMNDSARGLQQRTLSDAIHNSPRMLTQRQAMNTLLDGAVRPHGDGAMRAQLSPAPPTEKPNNTGLPDQLKSGIESLSGMSMDHVKVHYNSAKPAQMQAYAFAQGSEIHLGTGQERHLPHEAWHVVQQAQGRVNPTVQLKTGIAVNDDVALEREADVMGALALDVREIDAAAPVQGRFTAVSAVVQRQVREVPGCPGLFFDDDSETYLDGEGNTYEGVEDFKRRKGSSSKLTITEDKPKKNICPVIKGDAYADRPALAFNIVTNKDVRGISGSNSYHYVYRFADADNPNSMYPYPGQATDQLKMEKVQQDSDTMLTKNAQNEATGVKDGPPRRLFAQKAILTVAYGRDQSPFIPVGVDYHRLANHKNRLMQEIVRTPAMYEVDPVRLEDPTPGKRAPHVLMFAIPTEKAFLVFDTKSHDEQANSAGEQEVFGPMAPFLRGWVANPY